MRARSIVIVGVILVCWSSLVMAAAPSSATQRTDDSSVRGRLLEALGTSRALVAKAEQAEAEKLKLVAPQPIVEEDRETIVGYPRSDHVRQYRQARPWSWSYDYRGGRRRSSGVEKPWPTSIDAPGLRELLHDPDPAVRSLSLEVLATLHEPSDVERIGRLLADSAQGVPVLGYNMQMSALYIPRSDREEGDTLILLRSWHLRTVRIYAREALRLMTGRSFDNVEQFNEWWSRNSNGRECLWYWQERLQREMDDAFITVAATQPFPPKSEFVQGQRDNIRRAIANELSRLSPEVEAKVFLIAADIHAGGADITGPTRTFQILPLSLRLDADRLIDLMNRKSLWPDVEWAGADGKGRENYNRMVERIALSASILLRPEHVTALRAVLERERETLWWSGRAALIISISRLLPAAQLGNLDEPNTRDGELRLAVRAEREVFTRGYAARELVRVGLPANWPFIQDAFFAEHEQSSIPDLRGSILAELGAPPLTQVKRTALIDLLLDERFSSLWTQPNGRMGMDMYRREAASAVNAYAGRELITIQDKQALVNAETSAVTLAKVRSIISSIK